MASTFTPSSKLELPGSGDYQGTWDIPINRNLSKIDAKMSGVTTLNLALGDASISTSQTAVASADCALIQLVGTLTGNRTVTLPPNFKGVYFVDNRAVFGPYTITLTSSGLTGVVLNSDTNRAFTLYGDALALRTYEGAVAPTALIGEIRLYRGSITNEAELNALGWYLCNGQTVEGYGAVADLRDSFIRGGSGLSSSIGTGGSTGGSTSAATISFSGTTSETSLTVNQIPAHTHTTVANATVNSPDISGALHTARFFNGSTGDNEQYRLKGTSTAPTLGPTSSAGQGQGHAHTFALTDVGTHNHTFNTPLPPHKVVAYIEYTGVFA